MTRQPAAQPALLCFACCRLAWTAAHAHLLLLPHLLCGHGGMGVRPCLIPLAILAEWCLDAWLAGSRSDRNRCMVDTIRVWSSSLQTSADVQVDIPVDEYLCQSFILQWRISVDFEVRLHNDAS